jgi:hypothetical protein
LKPFNTCSYFFSAPQSQHSQCARVFGIVGHDHAGFPVGAKILARVEAETRHVPQAAGPAALVLGPMRLRGVFDQGKAVPARDFAQRVHVRRLPVQVHRQNDLGALGYCRLDAVGIHGEEARIDVYQHRLGMAVMDCGGRRHEGKRHRDDLISRLDTRRKQREMQSARAAVDSHGMLGLAVRRVFLLQRRHFGAKRELAAVQHALDGRVDFGLDARVLRLQIDERNHEAFP